VKFLFCIESFYHRVHLRLANMGLVLLISGKGFPIPKEDFILMDIEEINGLTINKDFEIEVFKIETVVRTGFPDEEVLTPLTFIDTSISPQYEITEDDVLVKKVSSRTAFFDAEITKRNVSYFLNINTDDEISNKLLCSLDPLAKKRSVFSNRFVDCDDIRDQQRDDIYGQEEEFEDPCEE